MVNENHNSKPGWKSKLEELESLPGEAMPDKNASWEKLHAKLEGKKPVKKPLWYWLAAASVLFFLIIAFFISNKKTERLPGIALKQTQHESKREFPKKDIPAKTENHNKDSFTVKNSTLPGKSVPVIFDKANETAYKNITGNKKNEIRLYDTVSTHNKITVTINNSLQSIDTLSNTASIIPAKKKLAVVHINELSEPGNMPQIVRNLEKPAVHFLTLGSGQVYNGTASATKNFATINFKTSPN